MGLGQSSLIPPHSLTKESSLVEPPRGGKPLALTVPGLGVRAKGSARTGAAAVCAIASWWCKFCLS